MALKAVVDSTDGMSDDVKAEYTEREGKFYLNVEDIDSHPDVLGLKSKKEELLTKQKELKEKLKTFDGIDAEKARAAIEEAEAAHEQGLIKKGDVDSLKKEYEQKLEKQQKESQAKLDKAAEVGTADSKAARNYFQKSEIGAAIREAGGEPVLLEPVVRSMTQVERDESSGDFLLKVIDSSGTPRIKDAQGTPVALADLLDELKADEKYGRAFDASGAGGSGADQTKGGGGGAGKKRRVPRSKMGDPENLKDIAEGKAVVVDG